MTAVAGRTTVRSQGQGTSPSAPAGPAGLGPSPGPAPAMTRPGTAVPASRSVLYGAVAVGMSLYTSGCFRAELVGEHDISRAPGTIFAATHRSDNDVPLLCATLSRHTGSWRPSGLRPAFVTRHDLFLPGFLAAYPTWMPEVGRRLLFSLSLDKVLSGPLACWPVRPPNRARLVEVLTADPGRPLERLLPAPLMEELRSRAAACGLPLPERAGEAVRAEYARFLWTLVGPGDLVESPELSSLWKARFASSVADLRRFSDHLRQGGNLLIFPEGFPSADGGIGPLLRGVRSLAHSGRGPVQAICLTYDPLGNRRPRVVLACGPLLDPDVFSTELLLDTMRRTMPLTAGQVVAWHFVSSGAAPALGALLGTVQHDEDCGRPLEKALADPARRRRRLGHALGAAVRLGPNDHRLLRLAHTFRAAHG